MNKNIVLFGAGAIGSCIAAYLAREGHEITVIDPWFAHMVAIQKRGLHVTDPEGEFTVNMRALHVDQVKDVGMPIDILFLAVKSQDTEWSTRYLAPYLSTEGLIVSAQNSLNEEMISSVVGPEKTMGLVVSIPAAVYEPGEVVRNSAIGDRIDFQVGELDGSDTPRLRELAELMSKAGQIEITDNIWGLLWSKLGTNCMVNSIAGLTGLSLSPMCKNAIARKVMMRGYPRQSSLDASGHPEGPALRNRLPQRPRGSEGERERDSNPHQSSSGGCDAPAGRGRDEGGPIQPGVVQGIYLEALISLKPHWPLKSRFCKIWP